MPEARQRSHRRQILVPDTRPGRHEQLLDVQVRERDERRVGPVLEADEARTPRREELVVEAVQTLELEETVEAEQRRAQKPQAERRGVRGAQPVCEDREV